MRGDADHHDVGGHDSANLRESGPPSAAPGPAAAAPGAAVLHHRLVDGVREYAIITLDPAGRIVTWNAGATRMDGRTAEEMTGRHVSTLHPPDDIASGGPEHMLREALERGSVVQDGWRVRADGSSYRASVLVMALRDDAGELLGFGQVMRELVEDPPSAERLRQSEERFRLLVQSVRDYAIFMLDPVGRIVTWNDGAARIKGYAAEEIIGRHFSIFYPESVQAAGFPEYELRVATATGRFEDEGWRVRKDGSFFWASVVITALKESDGRLLGFAKVTRDLTERRQAQERALEDARRVAEVEAANRAKSEFLATLSHELRTPLNAIGGYSELLAMGVAGPLNDVQQQYLERVRASQRHLLGLVNDLLSLSRMEAGTVELDIGPIEMEPLLRELEAMIEPELVSRRVRLSVGECQPDSVASGDVTRVRQILINLLSNAVKFTPSGGRIILECAGAPAEVTISVQDEGPGIPLEQQDLIFEPFVQLGRSLTETKEGIGLGLAISRRLARAMSGDLRVTSEPGAGATFTLILPRATVDGGQAGRGR